MREGFFGLKKYEARESDSGFGMIEVVVSILLLAILGVLVAGALVQSILSNTRNVLVATASQVVTQEISRIQSTVTTCAQLDALIAGTTASEELVLGETKVIEIDTEGIGWATCGGLASGVYPVRLLAKSGTETLFSVDTLVVLK